MEGMGRAGASSRMVVIALSVEGRFSLKGGGGQGLASSDLVTLGGCEVGVGSRLQSAQVAQKKVSGRLNEHAEGIVCNDGRLLQLSSAGPAPRLRVGAPCFVGGCFRLWW